MYLLSRILFYVINGTIATAIIIGIGLIPVFHTIKLQCQKHFILGIPSLVLETSTCHTNCNFFLAAAQVFPQYHSKLYRFSIDFTQYFNHHYFHEQIF